ncbi:hypothetical protein [Streptomyces sp. RKAG293]|uniref:hypothetical protein n=1 Tax=Streptomyces sp. RKAG293 TaxID=2893403 RepID=UPI002034739D|nr:hypothetical protein [Streptomyces sp. RKAG293]MCM2417273.1 hypothetical protein [Streptomyces sp. RKAG293]
MQRIADLPAGKSFADCVPNPAHRTAKLLRPAERGRAAVWRIGSARADLGARLADTVGQELAEL